MDDDRDIAGTVADSHAASASFGIPRFHDAPDPTRSIDPWRLFRLIRRQVWTILAVMLALNLLAALLLGLLTPIYKASALVIVDPWQRSMLETDAAGASRPADGARVESEVEILRSPSVLLAVQNQLDLADDPEFAPRPPRLAGLWPWLGITAPTLPDEEAARLTLKQLSTVISITRRGVTYVIEVAARSSDPDKAARIANATAAAYIDAQIQAKVAFAANVQQRLAQQLESARASLRDIERRLDSFLDDSIGAIQNLELRAELAGLRAAIREQETTGLRYDALAGRARERARKREWDALIAELNSDRLVQLNTQHAALQQELPPGDDVPDAKLLARLVQLDRQIDMEAQAVIGRIAAEAAASRDSEAELRSRLSQRLAGGDVPADIVLHFREVEADAAALRHVVAKLTANSTAAMAEVDLQLPDSRIVSAALSPSTPAFPDRTLMAGLAGILSLVAGVGAALLRDGFAGGFADEADLEASSGVAVLAALPAIEPRHDRPGDRAAAETLEHPDSPYGEAIRRLRLGLDLASSDRRPDGAGRVVLMTAANAGEGTTLTAIALARSLGLSGRKTLLIDADLRQPSIHAQLDLGQRHGVADYLAGRGAIDGLIVDDIAPHVAIAAGPAGDQHNNIDTLLQSSRLTQLIQTARQNFDHVVIDSPPILPVIDALLLARHADDILMVVDTATPPRDVRAALRALTRSGNGTTRLRLVLNRAAGAALHRLPARSSPAQGTPPAGSAPPPLRRRGRAP